MAASAAEFARCLLLLYAETGTNVWPAASFAVGLARPSTNSSHSLWSTIVKDHPLPTDYIAVTFKLENLMSVSRRVFLENGAFLFATFGVCAVAWPDSAPLLSESDPTATALGYKANASSVDKAKFPQYKAGSSCSNCVLYQGAAGAASGPCPLYAGKAVSAQGWCSSYAKKP
jgi:hypothetical protein